MNKFVRELPISKVDFNKELVRMIGTIIDQNPNMSFTQILANFVLPNHRGFHSIPHYFGQLHEEQPDTTLKRLLENYKVENNK